jgi:hypothetical protein
MTLIERKAIKLLAQSSRLIGDMTSEALCDDPQKFLIKTMLADLRTQLDEFEDAYFSED